MKERGFPAPYFMHFCRVPARFPFSPPTIPADTFFAEGHTATRAGDEHVSFKVAGVAGVAGVPQ